MYALQEDAGDGAPPTAFDTPWEMFGTLGIANFTQVVTGDGSWRRIFGPSSFCRRTAAIRVRGPARCNHTLRPMICLHATRDARARNHTLAMFHLHPTRDARARGRKTSAYDFFAELGVDDGFVREFVDGASRDNYNQAGEINSFVDLVSLAGAGIDGTVYTLANGTTPLVENLLATSLAAVRRSTTVAAISRVAAAAGDDDAAATYRLTLVDGASGAVSTSEDYDAVIVAAPLEFANLTLSGFGAYDGGVVADRAYQMTHVTFVTGAVLSRDYFGTGARPVPGDILTVEVTKRRYVIFALLLLSASCHHDPPFPRGQGGAMLCMTSTLLVFSAFDVSRFPSPPRSRTTRSHSARSAHMAAGSSSSSRAPR